MTLEIPSIESSSTEDRPSERQPGEDRSAGTPSGGEQPTHRTRGAETGRGSDRGSSRSTGGSGRGSGHSSDRDSSRTAGRSARSSSSGRTSYKLLIIIALAIILLAGGALAFHRIHSELVARRQEAEAQAQQEAERQQNLAVDEASQQSFEITLTFTGDCILGTDEAFGYGGSFPEKYDQVNDPSWFFSNFRDLFSTDDATIVDMEGTLTDSTTRVDKEFAFKGPAEYADILVQGGVEAATLANNHSQDYGWESYTDTIEILENAGIVTYGYDRVAYLDIKGIKVALIGTYALDQVASEREEMLGNIADAQSEGADLIIVYAHWGEEKYYEPIYYQVEMGRAAVDAGADLVLGTHPHVLQGYEEYNGHYIVYSLGNFCFGGNTRPYDMDCYILRPTFKVEGDTVTLTDLGIIPCSVSSEYTYNDYHPRVLSGDEAQRVWDKIEDSNQAIAADY